MMLWRWNDETEQWQGHPLETANPIPLGPGILLPVEKGRCCLLVQQGPNLMVNGFPSLPLRILKDRDEIRVTGQTVYFTTESPPQIALFISKGKDVFCGRCKGRMSEGELSVQCPGCGTSHHQKEGLSCWSYDTRCSGCDQPTAGLSWQPEPLRSCRSGGHGKQNG